MSLKSFFRALMFDKRWTCSVCGAEIFGEDYFCPDCLEKLPFITGERCAHCGRKTEQAETYCDTCKNFFVSVDVARSVFDFSGDVPMLIKRFKYKNGRYLAGVFAKDLAPMILKNFPKADVAVYIPMTDKAKRKRGFNQTELLAREVSALTGLPVSDALVKISETPRQALLGRNERLKNLEKTFKITEKGAFEGKRVLIIDDVTTTGATAETVAKLLKKKGAAEVYLATIASVSKKKTTVKGE